MNKNKFILVDIDGVVNNIPDGIMKLYSEKKYAEFNEAIVQLPPDRIFGTIIRQLANIYNIIFLTGRPSHWRDETNKFLYSVMLGAPYHLAMRATLSNESSIAVKLNWVNQNLSIDQIAFAIEDRKDVAMAYRKIGIECMLVKEDKFYKGEYHECE